MFNKKKLSLSNYKYINYKIEKRDLSLAKI